MAVVLGAGMAGPEAGAGVGDTGVAMGQLYKRVADVWLLVD